MFNPFKKTKAQDTPPKVIDQRTKTIDDSEQRRELMATINKSMGSPAFNTDPGFVQNYQPSLQGQGVGGSVPTAMLEWYASHHFIGYQACALMAQHWLVSAACDIPVDDAIRNGFDLSVTDKKLNTDSIADIKAFFKKIKLNEKITLALKKARAMGWVLVIIKNKTDETRPDYYEMPFNADGVEKDSFKNMTVVEPYYVTPQLSSDSYNPNSDHFYEPEYWLVSGKKYHHSHCVVVRHCEVPDLLKPNYYFGGISLTQQIFEAVYAAISATDEANRLLMTKRLLVNQGDVDSALMNQGQFEQKMSFFQRVRNNFGVQLIDSSETLTQLETALAEVTDVIEQKFQLVAAVSRMPLNKLMQTQLKGFASSGDSESEVYRQTLESTQTHKANPIIEAIMIRVFPSLGIKEFCFDIAWNQTGSPSPKEIAELNLVKAQNDLALIEAGTITGIDSYNRIKSDPQSGYDNLAEYQEPSPDANFDSSYGIG